MDTNLTDEIIRNIVTTFFGIFQVIFLAGLGAFVKMYIDVRSLKKGSNSSFKKIRTLERKVFGDISSELDAKGEEE
jgi:hypothetical protein